MVRAVTLMVALALIGTSCASSDSTVTAPASVVPTTDGRFIASPDELAASRDSSVLNTTTVPATSTTEPSTTTTEVSTTESPTTDASTTESIATSTTELESSGTTTKPGPGVSMDVEFVEVEFDDVFDDVHIVSGWVPVGWDRTDFFGVVYSQPGTFAELQFANGCNGACEPQDWFSNLNGFEGPIQLNRDEGQPMLRDESIKGGWIQIRSDGFFDQYNVDVFRWDDEASFYFHCSAGTDGDDRAQRDDLVTLCLEAEPNWLN